MYTLYTTILLLLLVYFGWIFDCRRLCTVCTLCKQVVWSDFKDLPVLMWVCTLCALCTLQSFYKFCWMFCWIFDYRRLCTLCTLCTTSFWSYCEGFGRYKVSLYTLYKTISISPLLNLGWIFDDRRLCPLCAISFWNQFWRFGT